MADGRVREGALGCPNCRDAYPVSDGFGDLRAPPRRALAAGLVGSPRPAEAGQADRLAALIGVARGPARVALAGGPAALGPSLAARFGEIDLVGIDADLIEWRDAHGWSRMVSRPGLPFLTGVLRGVAADGRLGEAWIAEAARVCAPLARVVVTDAPDEASVWLERSGLGILVTEPGTVVAVRR